MAAPLGARCPRWPDRASAVGEVWEEKKFWDFVKGLKEQKPIWTSRNTEAMAKITSGEGWIGTGSYAAVEELKEKGAPVEFLFLGPALVPGARRLDHEGLRQSRMPPSCSSAGCCRRRV